MASPHFTRLASTSVLIQVHVSEDSRYVLLPQLEEAVRISGWLVYDTIAGELVTGPDDQPFPSHHTAREWVGHQYRAAG